MQPLSKMNMSYTPDEIFQNLRKGPRLEKTDILSFKSSEILPFRFYSFPEFNEKMKKYVQKSPTRIFPRNAAETLLQRGGAGGIEGAPLSVKYCRLGGKGMLRPPRSFEETPNELVDISWNTICGVFSHPEKITESRIILPNNFHLKTLLEKAGFCMYSNQHTRNKCFFFSCPPLRKREIGITKEIEARARESVKTLVAQEEFGRDLELDRDPESEEIEDSEDEVDYGDPDVEE